MVFSRSLMFALAILLSGCAPASASPVPATPTQTIPPTETAAPLPDAMTQIHNATYQLGATDAPRTIQFVDGAFQQGSPGDADFADVRIGELFASGDLNGDGVNETVVTVSENYGGSGVFVFLALYVEQGGVMAHLTSAFLDDRPVINQLSIRDRHLFLDSITHRTEDPFCCPTLHNQRHYRLIAGQLKMVDYVTFTPAGNPRTILLESPTNGMEVFSSVQLKGSVAIAPFENNLAYRIYDIGGVELSAGPLAVNAADLGGPGTFDAMINLGNLLSDTTIRIEVQDISAADGSLLAMDSVELVVK